MNTTFCKANAPYYGTVSYYYAVQSYKNVSKYRGLNYGNTR
jgi:hypothetical protein